MSDLLSLLSLGSAGIAAQNAGIAVASNNVANANTAGYSRQRVDLEALRDAPLVGGVRSGTPDRAQDLLLAGRVQVAAGSLAMSRAFAEALSDVEHRLTSGATITEQLAKVFSRISAVSAAPTESGGRDSAVAATRELVTGIRRRADELEAAHAEVNARIRDNAAAASSIAKRLAETNLQIARSSDPALRDERDRLAASLTELTGGRGRIDADGQMRFVLDGGAVLVDGRIASALEATPDPVTGDAVVSVVDGSTRRDVTTQLGGGKLAADLRFRDGALSRARTDLDQLAYDISTSFNAVHVQHAGLDGTTGRPLFTPPTSVAGAARAMAIDPAIDADPQKLAAGAPGAGPGDNQGAIALFALASRPVATGGKTLTDASLELVSKVGLAASEAQADVERDQLVGDHLAGLRDSLAGVDIQEELANLSRFEHASSAMAKFVSTIDGLLGDLIDRL